MEWNRELKLLGTYWRRYVEFHISWTERMWLVVDKSSCSSHRGKLCRLIHLIIFYLYLFFMSIYEIVHFLLYMNFYNCSFYVWCWLYSLVQFQVLITVTQPCFLMLIVHGKYVNFLTLNSLVIADIFIPNYTVVDLVVPFHTTVLVIARAHLLCLSFDCLS